MATRNIELPRYGGGYEPRPTWGGVGGLPRSAEQHAIDFGARRGLDAEHEQVMGEIDRREARIGDPTQRQIEGRKRAIEYERLQPYGATSEISATFGEGWGPGMEGAEVGSDAVGNRPMGEFTIGEARAIERDREQQSYRDLDGRALARLDRERASLAEELRLLAANLNDDVQAGRLRAEVARDRYKDAERKAAIQADMLKRGGNASGYFRDDLLGALPNE